MLRFAADENFNNHVVSGLLRRRPDLDIVRVQDVGLRAADDPEILEWAASERRILLTHDVSTMRRHVKALTLAGRLPAGVAVIPRRVPVSVAIEEILLLAECSLEREWEGRVFFLPLR